MPTLQHKSLNATLHGVEVEHVNQYRGIPYGKIPARFALSEPLGSWDGEELDCRNYGPRCPQNYYDVGYLLRIPDDHHFELEHEDEFQCLNLDVALPSDVSKSQGPLPVLVWIHGGSQIMTFASGTSRICDTTRLVADSVKLRKPMIIVSVAYRLNIFAFGDNKGEVNLALKDQRLAIDWVQKHISGFGGDPNNVTVAGESAGGVYAHAHVVTGAPMKRIILSSGSLYLSPPMPKSRGEPVLEALEKSVASAGHGSLREAPVEAVLKAQVDMKLNSLWLQQEPQLDGWEKHTGNAGELLVGDVEYEGVLWRNGIEQMSAEEIYEVFMKAGDKGPELAKIYGVGKTRPTPSKIAALDFMTDMRFAWPVVKLIDIWKNAGKPAYHYVIDQANPWQESSRSHHALDLIFLFGGFDLSFNQAAEAVGQEMRKRWISFINGESPWPKESIYAFGPFGECKEIDEKGFAARRRVRHWKLLESMEPASVNAVFGALAAGRISLLN